MEKEMATHSGILAWRVSWTEEHGGLQATRSQKSDTTERLLFTSVGVIYEKKIFSKVNFIYLHFPL